MSSVLTHVFVYGTLKKGHCRHHYLADQEFLSTAKTIPQYVLVNLGDYPGLVLPTAFESDVPGESVQGELYRVDDACLTRLDQVEGVDEGLYQRAVITLMSRVNQAVTYLYQRPVVEEMICGNCWNHPR